MRLDLIRDIRLVVLCVCVLIAGGAFGQTTIEPLPNAPSSSQPGAYGSSQPGSVTPQYPSVTGYPTPQSANYVLPDGVGSSQSSYATPQYPVTNSSPSGESPVQRYPVTGSTVGYPQTAAPYSQNTYPQTAVGTGAPMPTPGISPIQVQGHTPTPVPMSNSYVSGTEGSLEMSALPAESYEPEPQYSWYHYPWAWIPRDGWDSSIEFGLNGAEGNTRSLSYVAGADISRTNDIYNFTMNLDYRRTQSGGLETQNNARFNTDIDRAIAESKFATFIKGGLEYDEFKAFDLRLNGNAGLSYLWAKSDEFTFITRFGAGASSELGSVNEDWKPEALFGLETDRQVNSRNRVYVKVDYFPAWEDFSDYRMVTDAGWEILLDDSENFSLKLSALNRYDSTPLGLKAQDIDYAATLLYKF